MLQMKTYLTLTIPLVLSSILYSQQERGFRNVVKDPETGTELKVYDESWAVIIGIDKYQHVPKLSYAVADAESIRSLLVSKFGFKENHIVVLTNQQATKQNILRSIGNLYNTEKQDRAVIFFAGHGKTQPLPGGGEMGFIIPVDGKAEPEGELMATCISMRHLRDEFSPYVRAKHLLFLVDACYGGLATTSSRSLSKETVGFIKKITSGTARQIITAGSKDEQVIERDIWGHSAFTFRLLSGLGEGFADQDADGFITAKELHMYLERRVSELTENAQTPKYGRYPDDEGEFLFVLPEASKAVITISPRLVKSSTLIIGSDPLGGEVYLNGNFLGKTPIQVPDLEPGRVNVKIKSLDYADYDETIQLAEGSRREIRAKLMSKFGLLSVLSIPEGAQVYVNGALLGVTPIAAAKINPGNVEVRVVKEEFSEWGRNATVLAGKETRLDPTLTSTVGSLAVNISPSDAEVYVAGKSVGKGSFQGYKLPAGRHEIRVSKEEFSDYREFVTIEPGSERPLTVKLESSVGFLSVSVSDPIAEIRVDGKRVSSGSLQGYKLTVGDHTVEVRDPSSSTPPRETIHVRPGRESKLEARFGVFSATPLLRSMFVPGLGQLLNGSGSKGVFFLVGAIGGGAYTYKTHTDYTKKSDAYNSTVYEYQVATTVAEATRLRNEMNARYAELDQAKKNRNIAFLGAGGLYLLNLLDALIFESSVNEMKVVAQSRGLEITPSIAYRADGVRWGFEVRF